MNSPSPPPAPDPVATAQAQGQMNKETAIAQAQLNMVDQNGPNGSSAYRQTGTYSDGTPKFEQNVTLSPTAQALYNSQNNIQQRALDLGQGAIGKVQSAIDKPFDISNLPGQVYGVTPGQLQTDLGPNYRASIPGQQYQTSFGDAGPIQRSLPNTDYAANVKSVQDALMARLEPNIEADRRRRETTLANQGITQGSDAYNRATTLGEQAVNDQRTQALLAASQEQSRLAGLDLNAGNFANSAQQQQYNEAAGRGSFANDARTQQLNSDLAGGNFANNAAINAGNFANAAQAQAFGQDVTNANMNNAGRASGIQEAAYLRSQPINELASLMGFSPGVAIPNFQNTTATGIAPPDYMGAVNNNYNAQMQAYQAQQQANSSMLGSIFGLGGKIGAAAIMSDRRAKKDIRRIGTADNGLPIYSFKYKGGDETVIGFMADEVEKVKPWAVLKGRDGFKRVNYELAAA